MSYTLPTLKNITPEEKILFACTRQNFLPEHQQTVVDTCNHNSIDWEWTFGTAKLHGVAPLVYTNLQKCATQIDIPPAMLKRFKLALMQNILTKENISKKLIKAITFFQKQAIEVMLIKGGALDLLVYERPYYTVINDVDLVLNIKRDDITAEMFNEFMAYFGKSGVEYDYFAHHDVSMNGVLPVDFRQIWQDAEKIEVDGHQALVMSPEDMLISLCINSCRKRYFRLKALCDIAETVNKYRDLNWQQFIEKATIYHCQAIVYAALLVTKMTLDCNLPDGVLEKLKINPVRAKIIGSLSQRFSLSAFSSLYSGKQVLGRSLDVSLILPYATFRWSQIWRRIKFAALFTEQGTRRIGFWPELLR